MDLDVKIHNSIFNLEYFPAKNCSYCMCSTLFDLFNLPGIHTNCGFGFVLIWCYPSVSKGMNFSRQMTRINFNSVYCSNLMPNVHTSSSPFYSQWLSEEVFMTSFTTNEIKNTAKVLLYLRAMWMWHSL